MSVLNDLRELRQKLFRKYVKAARDANDNPDVNTDDLIRVHKQLKAVDRMIYAESNPVGSIDDED